MTICLKQVGRVMDDRKPVTKLPGMVGKLLILVKKGGRKKERLWRQTARVQVPGAPLSFVIPDKGRNLYVPQFPPI